MTPDYFAVLARYNQWANNRLFDACHDLGSAEWHRTRDSVFPSLHHTLCHLYVGDRLWLSRFQNGTHPGFKLDTVPFDGFDDLWTARQQCDQVILDYVADLSPLSLAAHLDYQDSKGNGHRQVLAHLLAHFFNHQTHHRGQAHVMLFQAGGKSLPLDMVYYLLENEEKFGGF